MFNVQCFLDAANELVRLDEVERALQLLNNLPALYRDEEPKAISALRREILAKVATPSWYAEHEALGGVYEADKDNMRTTLRYQMVANDVKTCKGPHIVDFGPGPFWLAACLRMDEYKFSYQPICLDSESNRKAWLEFPNKLKSPPEDQPYIFCALEIIEHLWDERDIQIEAYRHYPRLPDIIHISTPCYAFDPNHLDWRTRDKLGHLRAYTPKEFYGVVSDMFKEYNLEVFQSPILHARLELKK